MLVVVVLGGVLLVSLVLLGEDDVLDDALSEFGLADPEGEVEAETLPEAFIEAVVDVSVDGVVVVVVLVAGVDVSVEVVVVVGVEATVVEPGVALVPELL